MSTSSHPQPDQSARAEFISGVRAFADFLEQNPDVKEPILTRFLLAPTTNEAAEAFAAEHGLTVEYDAEGNASCNLRFGPVVYRAYGYVDFDEHCKRDDERKARRWADSKGLTFVPAEGGESL